MTELIDWILELEYDMFDAVQGANGRASCQDDRLTFTIMRASQFSAWDETTLRLYYQDLLDAAGQGINLMAEKYGYMMMDTDPGGYQAIADLLQPVDPDKLDLIGPLLDTHRTWYQELAPTYHGLIGRGRPLTTEQAQGSLDTSVLTYLKGEWLTYSLNTLRSYRQMVQNYVKAERNMVQEILRATAQQYGFDSLDDAERSISRSGRA